MDYQNYPGQQGGWPQQPNPYAQQTPHQAPQTAFDPGNPYAQYVQGQQADATGAQTGYQSPYGGVQQPYAEPGYQFHFAQNAPQQGYQQAEPYQDPYHQQGYQQMPPQMGDVPPAGFPPQQRVPQRPRLHLTPFHFAVMAVILGFVGWYLYTSLAPEAARYGEITSGSLSANRTGDCLIVRNEIPYDAEGVTSVVYEAEEGSSVVRNDVVCKVYSSGYSTREMNTLKNYRAQIRDYQRNLIETETTYDARLDRVTADVLTYAKEVRNLISGGRGSLANQEKLLKVAVDARQTYLKNKYASDQRFSRLYDDETSQSQRIDSWTKDQTATMAGLVSFYSDGYEYGITGDNWTSFEPRQVRSMINGQAPDTGNSRLGKTTIYRMVQDGEWYVLFLSDDKDWNPVNGQTYALQLERFDNTQTYAVVENFTRSGGELLVRLRVPSGVKQVLYMRSCEAVLGENLSTLCVNERAIHVQDGMTGVVVVDGSTESFIPVNVIHYDSGNAYFTAISQGLLFEGQTVILFD